MFPNGLLPRDEHGVLGRERFFLLLLNDTVLLGRLVRQFRASTGENGQHVAEFPTTSQHAIFLRHCASYRPEHFIGGGLRTIFFPVARLTATAAHWKGTFIEIGFTPITAAWLTIVLVLAVLVRDRIRYGGRLHLLCWTRKYIYTGLTPTKSTHDEPLLSR